MVQIYLAGQTCGKVEETSRSWWQCGTANEAVKHLVLFIATCIYLRVDTWTGTSSIHDSEYSNATF